MRKKIFYTIMSLVMCLTLLVSASFAWLSLSTAPEILGIDTKIGANGGLEIALLSAETYMDPTLIKTLLGGSMEVQAPTISNLSWGNIVDLGDESYGLKHAVLFPSRLNLALGENEKGIVGSNTLSIADYSVDGRVDFFSSNTVSATYRETSFIYNTENQAYGVRAIGTVSGVTPQQSSLANARTSIRSYISAAKSGAGSVWNAEGAALLDLYERKYAKESDAFTDSDVAAIRRTAEKLLSVFEYIDSALRQGAIGYAATAIEDVDTFKQVKTMAENTKLPLSSLIGSVSAGLPASFADWVQTVENGKLAMNTVIKTSGLLEGGSYTWGQISPMLSEILNEDQVYLNENVISNAAAFSGLTVDNELSLTPNAGIVASIADFAGDYSTIFDYTTKAGVEMKTYSSVETPYLVQIADILDEREVDTDIPFKEKRLESIYGMAVDLAFRCNAQADLLLQTSPADRVSEAGDGTLTQGSGSNMRFTSDDLDTEQIVGMMDAIRVGFLDNQNTLIAVAKLNTSNYEEKDGTVSANLHLYEHTVSENGMLLMGERLDDKSAIMPLPQNAATVITVVVWLDGDYVENAYASISAKSMFGSLNLQFASSAKLIPSETIG